MKLYSDEELALILDQDIFHKISEAEAMSVISSSSVLPMIST